MLSDFYKPGEMPVSFELYPPKTDKGMQSLMLQVEQLVKLNPAFITCTYGAGGSTRGRTLEIVEKVKSTFDVPVAAHLTVVGSSVDDLRSFLTEATQRHVDYIVALRGDPPQGEDSFTPNPDGFRYANELVELINAEFSQLGVLVAGYPETHREAANPQSDLDNLKRKVDAGAQVIVSQLFFRNEDFYQWRERCDKAGITVPIVPGIFPIQNLAQISKIANLCGANIPKELFDQLNEKPDDTQWHAEVGTAFAIEQVLDLADHDVPGFHFYVLNQAEATGKIMQALRAHQEAKQNGAPVRS